MTKRPNPSGRTDSIGRRIRVSSGSAPDPEVAISAGPHSGLLDAVLASAARLQQVVPGAVLVGGTASAFYARHRLSQDHDHVLVDLVGRFDEVLSNLESLNEWSTARVQPGKIVLGSLGGIETGVRQLIRARPLEVERVTIDGASLVVPTEAEILRIKAWLALRRNQTRDYLDIAAIADHLGVDNAAEVLVGIDGYYADDITKNSIAQQVIRQLADPRPTDKSTVRELPSYKGLHPRWHDWRAVRSVLSEVSDGMIERLPS